MTVLCAYGGRINTAIKVFKDPGRKPVPTHKSLLLFVKSIIY